MYEALVVTITAIAMMFLGLTLVIVLNKFYREARDRSRRRRRQVLEPRLLSYVHGDRSSVLSEFPDRLRGEDRAVIEEVLLGHLERVKGIERERMRRALEELGYVEKYLAQLASARWWTRAQAAEKLGLGGASRAFDRLVAALDDPESEVRIRAAKALGALGGAEAVRPLLEALEEPSRWSSIRIADILSEMGSEIASELVAAFPRLQLRSKVCVLDILGRVRSLPVSGWLQERLADPEADVRARASHALGSIGDPEAGPALRLLLRDREWPVRAMAAKALGRIRHLPAIPDLCDAMCDREWWVRSNAARALGEMGGEGIAALTRMLDAADPFAKHQAILVLEKEGVLDETIAALAGPDPSARSAGEELARKFVRAGQVGRLSEIAVAHRNPAVRTILRNLLDEAVPAEGRS